MARFWYLLLLQRAFLPLLFWQQQAFWQEKFFLQQAFFYYRSFKPLASGRSFRRHLGGLVTQHQGFHFFQSLGFDLANALSTHAILSREFVQGRAT